jgi:HPt (histidine-containing phosphotransfer) domain-containing protein
MSNIDEIGDPTITLEIINEFLATVPTGLDSLMEELTGTIDWKLVEQKAHKLKGAVAVFQIKKMMEKLSAIEKMAKENNDTEKIPTLLSQCIDVFSVVEKELITLRQKIREELNDSQTTN